MSVAAGIMAPKTTVGQIARVTDLLMSMALLSDLLVVWLQSNGILEWTASAVGRRSKTRPRLLSDRGSMGKKGLVCEGEIESARDLIDTHQCA